MSILVKALTKAKKTYELDRVLDWVEPLKTFPDTYVLATSVQRCAEVCFFLKDLAQHKSRFRTDGRTDRNSCMQ